MIEGVPEPEMYLLFDIGYIGIGTFNSQNEFLFSPSVNAINSFECTLVNKPQPGGSTL